MSDLDVLAVGRVSVDLYALDDGPLDGVSGFQKSVGGTATNVAVASARLGHRTGLVTRVGDDEFGRYVQSALRHTFGVDTRFVEIDHELPTPLAFAILDPPEDPRLIFYRGDRAPDQNLSPDIVDAEMLRGVEVFWVPASRFAWEPSRSAVTAMLETRDRRAHTVLDLDWRPQFWSSMNAAREAVDPILDMVTIAIGNSDECEMAVGERDPNRAADLLLDRGLVAAIVKLGAEGVMVALADGTRETIAPSRIDVVCGLGAGDAFGGAFVHGLLSGWDLVRTVRFGNAAGAIVAGRRMCADAMPTLDEIERFMTDQEVNR